MRLYEFQAKALFRRYSIPVPGGSYFESLEDVRRHVNDIPVLGVVKAQVLTGGRDKAGGVRSYHSREEALKKAEDVLNLRIKGMEVKGLLFEEFIEAEREIYLGIALDRRVGMPVLFASVEGGVDIEEVPENRLFRREIPPMLGLREFMLREMGYFLSLPGKSGEEVSEIARRLYSLYTGTDAELVEINPLMVLENGEVVAADAKLTVDSDALFRHPELAGMEEEMTELERAAREKGIAFVQLEGDVGVIANGAGLTMATLDILSAEGITPGVFLDLGGTNDPAQIMTALRLMKRAKPSVILLNIFGGMTRCDTVAEGVIGVLENDGLNAPLVARIRGRNERKGREMLREAGITAVDTIEEAVKAVAALEQGR